MSLSVSPEALSRFGLTATSIAGVTEPPALTFETPSICSISGTILFETIAESVPAESVGELTPSVRIVASAGSNVPTVGAGISLGSCAFATRMRRCTCTRSVVLLEVIAKTAEMDACPCCTVVLMWSRSGAPAIASSIGRTIASRISVVEPPGYDARTEIVGKSMLGNCCCTIVRSDIAPATAMIARATKTSAGRRTKRRVGHIVPALRDRCRCR